MSKIVRIVAYTALGIVGLLVVGAAFPLALVVLWHLPWAWASYLARTLPAMSANWSGIGMAILCSALILLGIQFLGRWLRPVPPGFGQGRDAESARPWTWRWSVSALVSLWILFAVILGASGVRRQLEWLALSPEPLYVPRRSAHVDLRQAAYIASAALIDSERQADKTRATILQGDPVLGGNQSRLWESHQFVLFSNPGGTVRAVVIIPRNPEVLARTGFMLIDSDLDQTAHPADHLTNTLANLR